MEYDDVMAKIRTDKKYDSLCVTDEQQLAVYTGLRENMFKVR
jgi:hypothetical protein